MKFIARNLKFWHFWAGGIILLVLVMVSFFYSPQKATFQTSPSADDYVFIGEYNAGSSDPLRKCPTGYSLVVDPPSEHIGGNKIATCFKNNDKVSENNNLIIAVGSKTPQCNYFGSQHPIKKYESVHIGGNLIKTCSKFDFSLPTVVVGGVPDPVICPLFGGVSYLPHSSPYSRSRHIGGNYIGTCMAPSLHPIVAELTANMLSGLPPFNSVLNSTVSYAIGYGAKVHFIFDCNNGQIFTREPTTPTGVAYATVNQSVTCNYTEFKDYAPTVKVYQGDAPITYDGAVIKATAGLTSGGQPVQIKAEIQQIKIREVAP